jgi:hypothetical protein
MIKTPTKFIALLYGAALLTSSAFAQGVATDPVGYTSMTISSGYNTIGTSFAKAPSYTGTVSSATSGTLTLASSPTLDVANNTYYVEVLESSANIVGERIDVASVAGSVLTLDTAASHNTMADVSAFPVDTVVAIRSHYTLGEFNALLGDSVNSDDAFSAATSDQVLFFDGGFKAYLEFEGEWYENFGDFNLASDKVLAPGSGFFYYRNPGAGTPSDIEVVFTGAVRMNNFVQKLEVGYQFVSTGYPVDANPVDMQLNGNLEASTGFDVEESDLILTWDGSFKTHLLYNDGGSAVWYENFGDFNVVDSSNLLSASNAVLMFIRNTGQVLEVPRPF